MQVWINSFNVLKKLEKVVSGTCRSYVSKRYKCADKGCEKGGYRQTQNIMFLGHSFDQQFDNKSFQKFIKKKNNQLKTWNCMPKGFQNGAKIDTQTHQKPMPKLVTKRIMKIIKNPPTFWSGVLDHSCGGRFPPAYPPPLWAPCQGTSKHQPV